jgi:hypothetical protein
VADRLKVRELVEDCKSEADAISEHYYQERIPNLQIVEAGA